MVADNKEPDPVDELIGILDLERIEVNRFRGLTPDGRSMRVFGGQVISQALVAAYRTVEDRLCHSLHAYFIRPVIPASRYCTKSISHAMDAASPQDVWSLFRMENRYSTSPPRFRYSRKGMSTRLKCPMFQDQTI